MIGIMRLPQSDRLGQGGNPMGFTKVDTEVYDVLTQLKFSIDQQHFYIRLQTLCCWEPFTKFCGECKKEHVYPAGSVPYSIRQLADKFGWDRCKIHRHMKNLSHFSLLFKCLTRQGVETGRCKIYHLVNTQVLVQVYKDVCLSHGGIPEPQSILTKLLSSSLVNHFNIYNITTPSQTHSRASESTTPAQSSISSTPNTEPVLQPQNDPEKVPDVWLKEPENPVTQLSKEVMKVIDRKVDKERERLAVMPEDFNDVKPADEAAWVIPGAKKHHLGCFRCDLEDAELEKLITEDDDLAKGSDFQLTPQQEMTEPHKAADLPTDRHTKAANSLRKQICKFYPHRKDAIFRLEQKWSAIKYSWAKKFLDLEREGWTLINIFVICEFCMKPGKYQFNVFDAKMLGEKIDKMETAHSKVTYEKGKERKKKEDKEYFDKVYAN